jgi:chromosomal replication initiator protein
MNTLPQTPKPLGGEPLPFTDPVTTANRLDVAPPVSRWHGFLLLPQNRSAARAVRSVDRTVRAKKRPAANPLVLHGPPGTGKSHLLSVLAHQLATAPVQDGTGDGPTARIVSVGDLARAPAPDEGLADPDLFTCDLLALEDIQHANGRAAEAACELLDHRIARRRATVVTTNTGPSGLMHLPRRLTSRLAAGLVVRLEPLSTASRRVIVADAAAVKGIRLTAGAVDYLAERATGGGMRVGLGLLQNLAQVARTVPGPLGRAEVEQTLAETGQPTSAGVDVSVIVKCVAAAFGVSETDLLGASRLRGVLRSRQVAMYLARELTGLSLPRLGAAFGGRDHTTVLHACRKVEQELMRDVALAKQVGELRAGLE